MAFHGGATIAAILNAARLSPELAIDAAIRSSEAQVWFLAENASEQPNGRSRW